MFIVPHAIVVIVCVIVNIVVFFSLSQQFLEHVSVFFSYSRNMSHSLLLALIYVACWFLL